MQENNGSNEPIVLGKLKKQKTSKPLFVIFVFVVLLSVLFFVEDIQDYLSSTNSPINEVYNYFFGNNNNDEPEPSITKDTILTLSATTTINYEMIVLNQIKFNNEEISYTLKNQASELNLDNESLYLEIYNSSSNLLRRIKLTGTINQTETAQTVTFADFKFNASSTYLGRIYRMTDEDYPAVNFSTPVANLVCTKDNNQYTYTFNNAALTFVEQAYSFNNTSDTTLYMEKLQYYNNLAKVINEYEKSSAEVLETEQGLEFTTKLDLSKITLQDLGAFLNYDYYELNKTAKVVSYEMKAKGYICQ